MKKLVKSLSIAVCAAALVAGIAGCTESVTYVEDENTYTFTNPVHEQPDMDDYMTIDAIFDEDVWSQAKWLTAVDTLNSSQYADISFTMHIGNYGLYFAMTVEEHGTTIFYNGESSSRLAGHVNSCIEAYIGPVYLDGTAVENESEMCFEFDFNPDGSYTSKINSGGLIDANTTWDKSPVLAVELIGGALNTPECTGYIIEAFIPWTFLEHFGWPLELDEDGTFNPSRLIVGINPVHIFSFNYDGTSLTEDRVWSNWLENYINVGWLDPSSFLLFDENGLMSYEMNVVANGGTASVNTTTGFPLLYGFRNTVTIQPLNGATLQSVKVNGVDCTSDLRYSGGTYTLQIDYPETIVADGSDSIDIVLELS